MADKYVIARHAFGGIGDHLSCLVGAWWLAKQTGRTLAIDWRGSRFNHRARQASNCFHDYYVARDQLAGVEVIADDRVASISWPSPIFPAKWSAANLAASSHVKHTSEEIELLNRLVREGRDRPEPTIAINQWISPHPPREAVRSLLDQLQPVPAIDAEAQRFWSDKFGTDRAIGIHVRHGNGENIGTRAAYWLGPVALARQLWRNQRSDVHRAGLSGRFMDNMPDSLVGTSSHRGYETRFYRRIGREFRALAKASKIERGFLFTDAPQVITGLSAEIPGLVAFPKALMEQGGGPLHQLTEGAVRTTADGAIENNGIDARITRAMFVELELMRRCAALLCMDSGFSIFAQLNLHESRVRFLWPTRSNAFVAKVVKRLAA